MFDDLPTFIRKQDTEIDVIREHKSPAIGMSEYEPHLHLVTEPPPQPLDSRFAMFRQRNARMLVWFWAGCLFTYLIVIILKEMHS